MVRIGAVDVAGLSDGELSRLRADKIGFVFQQFFLAEHATVRENVAAIAVYARTKSWAIVIPAEACSGGIASSIPIGAFPGLIPAARASHMPPAVALRTV